MTTVYKQRFDVEDSYGVTVTDLETGEDRYFQMGDDAQTVLDGIEAIDKHWNGSSRFPFAAHFSCYEEEVDNYLSDYFAA